MVDESIIVKIQKILAKAGNNPNEFERNQCMEKAAEMAAQYNLDLLAVTNFDPTKVDVTSQSQTEIALEPWVTFVTTAITKLHFVAMYSQHYGSKKIPVFVGTSANISVALEVATSIMDSIRKESNKLYKTDKDRRSFRLGAASEVYKRAMEIIEARNAKPVNESAAPGTSLVLVKNALEKANDDFLKKNVPGLTRSKGRSVRVTSAYDSGRTFGGTIGLNKGIGGAKRIGAN